MFDLTQAALKKTISDLKKTNYWWGFFSQAFSIAYLTYAIVTQKAHLIANICLLFIGVFLFGFFLFTTKFGKEIDGHKKLRAKVNLLFQRIRRVIKFITLCITVYGIAFSVENPDFISLLLLLLSLIGFFLQILFDTLVGIAEKYKYMFMTAVQADVDKIKQPAEKVGNFFKRLTGKEVEAPPQKSAKEQKVIDMLQGIANQTKAERALSKQEKIAEKKRKKQEERARRKLKKLPAPDDEVAVTESEE